MRDPTLDELIAWVEKDAALWREGEQIFGDLSERERDRLDHATNLAAHLRELRQLRDAAARVRELHKPSEVSWRTGPVYPRCLGCGEPFAEHCPTLRALTPVGT